jgi:uncharacterized protein
MNATTDFIQSKSTQNSSWLSLAPYTLTGLAFGFVMIKSEASSWYRIQEMFRFQNVHMFGIIGSAILTAMIGMWVLRRIRGEALGGQPFTFKIKEPGWRRYVLGGISFGTGWALVGACPGPIFALIGAGAWPMIVVLLAAMLGTWTYAALRSSLPH